MSPPPDSAEPESAEQRSAASRRQVLSAAAVVAASFVLSRVLGLVREAVINAYFGLDSLQADAYALVSPIPELVFNIIAGGALGSAFIPVFLGYFARDDRAGGWRLFAGILNLVIVAVTVLAAVVAVVARPLLQWAFAARVAAVPGLLDSAVPLLQIMLISSVIFGVAGVVMATLHAHQHFLTPALAASVYNLGIIAGTVWLAPNVLGLGVGVVVGAVGFLAIQLPALRRVGAWYRPILALREPGVREVLWLMAPRVLGLSLSQLNPIVTNVIAQAMPAGSLRALPLAWRLILMPQSILGQAMGVASFPTFATLAAEERLPEMRRILAETLRLIFFLGLPIMVGLVALRVPLVTLLYQYGRFDRSATEFVAWGVLFYAPALVALASLEVVARAFYALKDTVTPVVAGAVQLIAMLLLGLYFGRIVFPRLGWLELGGVALGFTLSNMVEVGVLVWLLRRRMQGIDGRVIGHGVARMGAAAAVMLLVMLGAARLLDGVAALGSDPALPALLLHIALVGAAGGGSYLGLCHWLGLPEWGNLVRPIVRRLPKRR